ncbi:hypothetical protein J2067_001944 [Erwinia rhapontici]|nr:hypothetical protein [Erwinia rhapontici]
MQGEVPDPSTQVWTIEMSGSSLSVRQLKRIPGLGVNVSTLPSVISPSILPRCQADISAVSVSAL